MQHFKLDRDDASLIFIPKERLKVIIRHPGSHPISNVKQKKE